MATASSVFDDQTDEDFFDNLVNDGDDDEIVVAGSKSRLESYAMPRGFSNLSFGDEDAGFAAEDRDQDENEISKVDTLADQRESKEEVGSKKKVVRVVQWSSFDSSQHFDSVGFESEPNFCRESSENAAASNGQQIVDENRSQYWGNSMACQRSTDANSLQHWDNAVVSSEQQDAQIFGSANQRGDDPNVAQSWENSYPGWKYDYSTGQWYQIEGSESTAGTQSDNYNVSGGNLQENHQAKVQGLELSYLKHSAQSAVQTVAEDCTAGNVCSWNQGSQESNGYPSNMVFDPQYPEWYYDTNTQQWYTLESYYQGNQNTEGKVQGWSNQMNASDSIACSEVGRPEHNAVQSFYGNHDGSQDWNGSANGYAQQKTWLSDASVMSASGHTEDKKSGNFYSSTGNATNYADQQVKIFEPATSKSLNSNNGTSGFQSFVPGGNMHQFVQPILQAQLSEGHYTDSNSVNYPQQQFQGTNASQSHLSHANENRSSAGRPAHALVTFGFGGKLIIMKDSSGAKLDHGAQDAGSGIIYIHDLMEVVVDKSDTLRSMNGSCGYFHALCGQSFPGPLVGGNAGAKDVHKWIDEKIAQYESSTADVRKGQASRLLLSLLKISCQHYGKLRTPFGADPSLEESDGPESALTKLFTFAAKTNATYSRDYDSLPRCLRNIPSEGQILVTAVEVQNLLVSGRRKEALQCAQAGQLWGPALILAAQLGEKYYVETVKQMAQCQFTSGSPLRTLCLLIAGQPADVFSVNNSIDTSFSSSTNVPQQTTEILGGMLDDWEENLAIITANRTKDDELVIVHLGDCLWKERGEITAAHTCYLVAEASFEPYSDTSRICLIGADHWKYPRTYASPEAIQRTEIYEYAKVLGNSQFVLHQFQPYKLVYAHMLAEVGKTSDSLRYCQASLKLLKNSGRTPEVEMWKSLLSSLEERLRTYQEGGYSTNLAPAKLVGKLFTSIDRSIHRMMGGPTSPLPPIPQSGTIGKEGYMLSSSQSTMAMSSLVPSASVEGISEWTGDINKKSMMHARSISEPDFGRNPEQDPSKDSSSPDAENKASPSRLGRIGSQLLKTVAWVSRSRQAKLGESNKFYYDEKLKRWVEEGAECPAEEIAPPPPPPTKASFQNGAPDYNINNVLKNPNLVANGSPEAKSPPPMAHSSGIPPISPGPNQFSARGRMGVRSRYVDTFNKGSGGALTNSFPAPPVPTLKPVSRAKFFIPTASASSDQQTVDATNSENNREPVASAEPSGLTFSNAPFSLLSPPFLSPSSGMHSYPPSVSSLSPPFLSPSSGMQSLPPTPSMNSVPPSGSTETTLLLANVNGSFSSHSRRASWSGELCSGGGPDAPSLFMPSNYTLHRSSSSGQAFGGNPGEDLQEVAL